MSRAPRCQGMVMAAAAAPSQCTLGLGIPGGLCTSGRAQQHRAATMETPWLGKPMATHTSTWKPPAHGNVHAAASTRTMLRSLLGTPAPGHPNA